MAGQAQNAFEQLYLEAVHHRHHDDQGGHSQRDPDQGKQRDHRDEAFLPLGAQVTGRDHPLKGRKGARRGRCGGGIGHRGTVSRCLRAGPTLLQKARNKRKPANRPMNRRHFLAALMSACALPARAEIPRLRALLGGTQTSAMLVLKGGESLFEYGDLARTSYIASARKSLVSMLYGPAVARGKIRLDRTLAQMNFDDMG